jgi:excinuclease UvrABC ATPase subunit
MSLEYIEIRGARENNLKDISLRIPKRQITIFTGISGSGKSSLVFDTIASEARRQLNETFSTFVRNFLPRYAQPEADAIENLSMAIVVDQNRLSGGSHSTVGTVTDIFSVMRLLFSRIGKPYVGPAIAFSFNDPRGMCQECNGVGRKIGIDLDKFIDTSKSLNEGAILYPEYAVDSWGWNILKQSGLFDFNKKLDVYSDEEMDYLLHSKPSKVKIQMGNKPVNITFEGIVDKFTRKYIQYDLKTYSERTQKSVQQYMRGGPCPSCKGTRLNQAVLNCKIKGYNIAQLADMEVDDLLTFLRTIDDPVAAPIVKNITDRLQNVIDIGLEYLDLNRQTDTLSGGESQRIKMVKHLGSSLADMMYIFDEPSIGLHPRDVHRLNDLMKKLHDKGNTVLVVEHDPDVLRVADYIVDLGPRAGQDGGRIVFEGNWEALLRADTLTGKYTKETVPIKEKFRTPTGTLSITNATANNLQNVSVAIPLGVLTVITGVAGSGKSSLIHQSFVPENPGAIVIDQSPVGVSSRSNAATYTGIMDNVRTAFAKANQVNPSLFSFNSKGACENCGGLGVV